MSKNDTIFIVKDHQKNLRLDAFLQDVLETCSRSQILKWMKEGRVYVNNTLETKRCFVTLDDRIEIKDKEEIFSPRYKLSDIKIIQETKEYIIVSKPGGLIVHPTSMSKEVTLCDLIIERYPEIQKVGEDPLRPGIIHRLDKDASGIMVIARTQDAFDHLKRQFKLRRVTKEYLIFVYGRVTPLQGIINAPIARSKRTGLFAVHNDGNPAVTNYSVEKSSKVFSCVRVTPESGRTHQIRVHFFSRGFPLVGDKLYKRERGIKKIPVSRLMLHASKLGFFNQNEKYCEYISPPSAEFLDVMRTYLPS